MLTARRINVPQVAVLAAMLARASPADNAPYAAARVATRICTIGRAISRLDEKACGVELTPADEKRLARLFAEADELAQMYGLKVYHQGDPRGASLYIYNRADLNGRDISSVYSDIGTAAY